MDAEWLRNQFSRTGYKQVDLARALGIHETIVNKMVKGRRRIQAEEVPIILEFFDFDGEGSTPDAPKPRASLGNSTTYENTPIVIFRSSALGGGRSGGVVIHKNEKRGETERNIRLRFADRAYAFELSEDFGDAYQVRDVLVLDPDSSPTAGDDCFFARAEENPLQQGLLRRLIRRQGDDWIVRVYGEDRETKLSRSEFPIAWRVRQRIMRD